MFRIEPVKPGSWQTPFDKHFRFGVIQCESTADHLRDDEFRKDRSVM